MRIIDADKLMRIYFDDDEGNKTFEFVPSEFIDSAPTVDAVPVVRCKDCKWWEQIDDGQYGYCSPRKYGFYKGDWFCADGERRAE